MSRPGTVGVVIPCYNHGEFLPEAIESVLSQTRAASQITVVDDGSTDDTAAIAKGYWPKVNCIGKQNGGLSSSRNAGVRETHTDYVVFLDADDKLAPRFIERCAAVLDADDDAGFVYTQLQRFGRETTVTDFPDYDVQRLKRANYINATSLIRASVFERFSYDEAMRVGFEDWDFYLTLAAAGIHGVRVDEPLVLWRKHVGDTSMSDTLMARADLQLRLRRRLVLRHLSLYTPGEIARAILRPAAARARALRAGLAGDSQE